MKNGWLRIPSIILPIIVSPVLTSESAKADLLTNSWISTSDGRWETATNWSLGIPSIVENAILITNPDNSFNPGVTTKTVTLDNMTVSNAPGSLTLNNLFVQGTSGSKGTINSVVMNNMFPTPLAVENTMSVEFRGSFTGYNSKLAVGTGGLFDDGNMTFTICALSTSNTVVGDQGTGTLLVSNTDWEGGSLTVGLANGSQGTITVTDGNIVFMNNNVILGQGTNSSGTLWITDRTQFGAGVGDGVSGTSVGVAGSGQIIVSNTASWAPARFQYFGVDPGGQGTLTVAGGTIAVGTNLTSFVFGNSSESMGTFWMTSGEWDGSGSVIALGIEGSGQMTLSNGTVQLGDLEVGSDSGGGGTLTEVNGTLTTTSLEVGSSTGTVWFGGGQLIASGTASINGQVTISNGFCQIGSLWVGNYFLPQAGTFLLAGGTLTCGQLLVAKAFTNSTGSIAITGGQLNATGSVTQIGSIGSGELTMSGGEWLAGGIDIAEFPLSQGTITVAGGQLVVTNAPGQINVGSGGTGHINILGGSTVAQTLVVGGSNNALGELIIMPGATVTVSSNLTVGNCSGNAFGVVDMTGGSLYVTNSAHNAVLELQNGFFQLNGGLLVVDKLVATNGCGVLFDHIGGTLSVGTLLLDPNGDIDGDGLPNGWEQAHGLDPLSSVGNNGADGDPDGDGYSNLQEYLAGSDPQNPLSTPLQIVSPFQITSIVESGNNVLVTWKTIAGTTNQVQVANGPGAASFSTNAFSNLGAQLLIGGSGIVTTNFLDVGGSTNKPSRYYRVRLVP